MSRYDVPMLRGKNKDNHQGMLSTDQLAAVHRDVATLVGDVLFQVDAAGHISWGQDLGAILLGYEPHALMVKRLADLEDLVSAEDRGLLVQSLEQLKTGGRIQVDVRMQHQQGYPVWVQIAAGAVADCEGADARMVGVIRSTEALHRALTSLSEARRMETVGNMASGIAHEFNNHLTPISGYLELALDAMGLDHPLADGLQSALDRAQHCAELVAQIQAYGQKLILMQKRVDAKPVIQTTLRLMLSTFPENADRVTVREEWDAALPDLWVDQGQFQQALTHLIRNAMEAMPDGGTLTVRAAPHSDDPASGKQFVRIVVRDTGKGIRAEDLKHIFEPFFTTRGRAEARGMGLPMIHGMAAQHGGWVEVNSREGQGTEVSLYLPAAPLAESDALPQVDPDGTMKVEAAASPGRLLIADDEGFIRRLVRKIFENEGWQIDEARDYYELIATAKREAGTFDLIIVDLTMPGPSIEVAVPVVVEAQSAARILFISGYSRDERIERLMEQVPSDFIGKPFSPKALVSKVDALLAVST